MWTPRRVLLLIVGIMLFGSAFGVYSRFLGWIDGLPQLPDEFLVRRLADEAEVPPASATPTDAKLQMAFPGFTPEVNYFIKIELKARGIVFAANEREITPDGRLKLWPFSLATFKEPNPGEYPEINTVHCDVAYLEFDRPIQKLREATERRLIGCELVGDPKFPSHDPRRGQVHFANNRSTAASDDDLILITPGPVYFREASNPAAPIDKAPPQVRTDAVVRLVDLRNQPQATSITAQGMRVYLNGESQATRTAPAKSAAKRSAATSGVRRVVLPENVSMNLWMEPGSGFLESAKAKPALAPNGAAPATGPASGPPATWPPAAKPAAERTNVQITTLGPFTYDVLPDTDRARFDRLPPGTTNLPDFVRVVRPQTRGPGAVVYDQLECDHLEIQFARRPYTPDPPVAAQTAPSLAKDKTPPPAPAPGGGPTVEWIHAWGSGPSVVLTSDEERLEARGNDLFHDALAKRTVLKGVPEMVAAKDTHEIHAPELVLFGADSKEGQQAQAHGPGYLLLNERDQRGQARWKESLIFRKEDALDRITLNGDASFDNPGEGQSIHGDQIKLVLAAAPTLAAPKSGGPAAAGTNPAPPPPANAKPPEKDSGTLSGRKPKSLEVTGHVSARSLDLNIHDTDHLIVLFSDAPDVQKTPGPNGGSGFPVPATGGNKPTGGLSGAAAAEPAKTTVLGPAIGADPTKPTAPAKMVIDVRAGKVQAFVRRHGDHNELEAVYCEDKVHVHQDPPTPQEKPIDMRGRKLELKHTLEGNELIVFGDLQEPAEVDFPELSLFGPRVRIDQIENVADVEGIGGMRMDSQTDFQGNKLKQPAPILITWKQKMHFNGLLARFHGHVQATQNNTIVLCHNMHVHLDRPVSLTQAPADRKNVRGQPANVDRVICDMDNQPTSQRVSIEDSERDARGRLIKYQRIDTIEVEIYKEEGKLDAKRGEVRMLQLGPKGQPGQLPASPTPPPNGKKPANPPPAQEEFKLTWVRYTGSMNVKNQSRTVTFWDNIDVLHLPFDHPGLDLSMNQLITKLPADAMHLRCQLLTLYSSKTPEGKSHQVMEARDKAFVNWQNEFNGWADVIRFDESKQQVVLEGSTENLARVLRYRVRGGQPGETAARKITYNRLTDSWDFEGTRILSSGPIGN